MKKPFKLTQVQIKSIAEYAKQGLTDKEIAKIFGNITDGAIFYWRKKLGIHSEFTYEKISKANHEQLIRLFNQGLSDYKIAEILHIRPCSVFSYRKYHNIGLDRNLKYNSEVKPTDFQMQVLIGTLLGDASLRKTNTNPDLTCAHCIKQKEYCEYKANLLKNLGAHVSYHKRKTVDKRTGLYYEDYTLFLPANPAFLDLYTSFYHDGVKVLPLNLLDSYTKVSLAFHYMDDGYKLKNGYALSTNCFSRKSLIKFIAFLKFKFDLNATLWKSNVVYIHKDSVEKFRNLVSPYICNCMKYKL